MIGRDQTADLPNQPEEIVKGSILFAEGKFEAAIDTFTIGLGNPPHNMWNHYLLKLNRGRAYLALGQIDEALSDFLNARIHTYGANILNLCGSAFFFSGLCSQLKGLYLIAMEDYNSALSARGTYIEESFFIYFNRALLHVRNKDFQFALDDFEKALMSSYRHPKYDSYVAAARIFKHICLLHLDQEVNLEYFDEVFLNDNSALLSEASKIALQSTNFMPTCGFTIPAVSIVSQISEMKTMVSSKYVERANSNLILGNIAASAKYFQTAQLLGASNVEPFIYYTRGLDSVMYGNTEDAKNNLDKAISEIVTKNGMVEFALWPSQRLHSLVHLRKLGVNVSLKAEIESVNKISPKTLTNICLLLIASSMPKHFNVEVFTESLENLFQFQLKHVPAFIKEELIESLTQPQILFEEKLSALMFKNIAEFKQQLLDLLFNIKNPLLRQTALLQALMPKTILGEIYNAAQGPFSPTLSNSKNKQKIAAMLLEDLRKRGPLIDERTKKLFDGNIAAKQDISANCPELYNELLAAIKLEQKSDSKESKTEPVVPSFRLQGNIYVANYIATPSGYKPNHDTAAHSDNMTKIETESSSIHFLNKL